jgi:hypothetical protein
LWGEQPHLPGLHEQPYDVCCHLSLPIPPPLRSRALDRGRKGFTTFDLADHYGPSEELVGALRDRLAAEGRVGELQAFTKWVPRPGPMTRAVVEAAVRRSMDRMKVRGARGAGGGGRRGGGCETVMAALCCRHVV